MLSKSIWQYWLVVPLDAVAAADTVAPALANPDGIVATFRPFPEDEPTHYYADFVACDLASEGVPSREALVVALGASSALSSILWVRCANPHHPNTTPEQMGIVVASNWAAFAPGDAVDWEAVIAAMAAE